MKFLIRALHAELLKSKRTLAFWLALIAPLVVIALQVAMMWEQREYMSDLYQNQSAWYEYGAQTGILWGLLMLPLFVTLETALVAQWEHRNGQWKHLFALPIPRWALYAAKQASGMALIGLSIAALFGLIVLSGWGLRLLIPGLGFEAAVPWGEYATYGLTMFLGAWLIIAIQTWVAQRWPSFAVASGVGIAMTVAGAMVIQSDWANVYPYTLPVIVANGFVSEGMRSLNGFTEGLPWAELLVGSLGGLMAALAGGWQMIRRDVL
ncbi:MAG: ABC transporter permease [Anaerolineae bacterium]|nr:ABC transporter permease [Anaerolineae bacterium]